ncbi:MAG TPA: hypothetical protein PL110_00445 [Candidatus Eremiobacteraeota bacterium]|nr:MAG: hypothetical protein BWY64_00985 [bacterium ADurb.Bin363]HPZ06555.1 hypothetical protein [Candidatus Eremiobacteraeota bacterium]
MAGSMCLRHQERPAVGRCKLCLKPVCEECKIETADGIFCGEECKGKSEAQKEKAIQTHIQVQLDTQKQQRLSPVKNFLSFLMLLAGLGVVGAIVWFFLLPQEIKIQIQLLLNNLLKK